MEQKLAPTMSAMLTVSMHRPCPNDVSKEMTGVRKNTLEDLQDKDLKQTSCDAELLEYKQIFEILGKNVDYKTEMIKWKYK